MAPADIERLIIESATERTREFILRQINRITKENEYAATSNRTPCNASRRARTGNDAPASDSTTTEKACFAPSIIAWPWQRKPNLYNRKGKIADADKRAKYLDDNGAGGFIACVRVERRVGRQNVTTE
jgi:hypothetical protein